VPLRIVSLAPAATETLLALGLRDDLAAVSSACPQVGTLPRLPFGRPEPRAVLDLKPGLVVTGGVGTSGHQAILDPAQAAGVTTHRMAPADLGGVLEEFLRLGMHTGRHKEASELIDRTRAALEAVLDQVKPGRRRAYLEVAPHTTIGQGHWLHDALEQAGGTNVFADVRGEQRVEPAQVDALQPDARLAAWDPPAPGAKGKVLDGALLRPGPNIALGLEQLRLALQG
jgi:iron complex transport system substrate-binding protein